MNLIQTIETLRKRAIALFLERSDAAFWILGAFLTMAFLVVAVPLEGQRGDVSYLKIALKTSQKLEAMRAGFQDYLQAPTPEKKRRLGEKLIEVENDLVLLSLGKEALRSYVSRANLVSTGATDLPADLYQKFFEGEGKILELTNRLRPATFRFLKEPSPEKLAKLRAILDPLDRLLDRFTTTVSRDTETKVAYANFLYALFYPLSLAVLVALKWLLVDPLVARLRESLEEAERERRFVDQILETAPVGLLLLRPDLGIERCNRRFLEEAGLEEPPDLLELLPEEAQDTFFVQIEQILAGGPGATFEVPLLRPDGSRRDFLWRATRLEGGRLLLSALDITERKRSEEALREAYRELERLHGELEQDLELAAHVQKAMLPAQEIHLAGLEGQAYLQTSTQVGGDYYDFYPVDNHRSVVLIGDVTGHGVAAGMVVSAVKSTVLQLAAQKRSEPGEILAALNRTICDLGQALQMTMLVLSFDGSEGRLRLASAGHLPPFLKRSDGTWQPLDLPPQLQLGLSPETDYRQGVVQLELELGQELLLYTDGLVEAERRGEPFGFERLERALAELGELPLSERVAALVGSWRRHLEGTPPEDDVTLLLLRHHERVTPIVDLLEETEEVVRFPLERYRAGDHPPALIDRDHLVVEAEGDFADWLEALFRDGVHRILPVDHPLYRIVPQSVLIRLHRNPAPLDDLAILFPHAERHPYTLTHTEEKPFLLEELRALVLERTGDEALADRFTIALDELVENAFYAAPRDGHGRPLYRKGEERSLEGEEVAVTLALREGLIGLQVVDRWGTLRPEELLYYISQAHRRGVLPGEGRLGLYTIWRMSDYFQVRVYPGQKTASLALWTQEEGQAAGLQGFFHRAVALAEEKVVEVKQIEV